MLKRLELKQLMRVNVGAELSYKGVRVTIVDDYNGPRLHWEGMDVANKLFECAWLQAQRPRYPRYVPESDRYLRFEDFDEDNYTHRALKRHLLFNPEAELPDWLKCHEWHQLQKTFNRLAMQSPFAGAEWAEPFLIKKTPWCKLSYTAELIIKTLSETFLPCATVTHRVEHFAGKRYVGFDIGHEDGHPLVWRYTYDYGTDHENVLDAVNLKLYEDHMYVTIGHYGFYVRSEEELKKMLAQLPAVIDKIWLEAMNRVQTGRLCMHSLRQLVLNRDEDYDTQVLRSEVGPDPKKYNFRKALVPTELDYMTLYKAAEDKLKEVNNG